MGTAAHYVNGLASSGKDGINTYKLCISLASLALLWAKKIDGGDYQGVTSEDLAHHPFRWQSLHVAATSSLTITLGSCAL